MSVFPGPSISLTELISIYKTQSDALSKQISSLSTGSTGTIDVGKFLTLELAMGKFSTMTDTISNLLNSMASVAMNTIRNLKIQ